MRPRLIRPHATYAICRRVEGRRFLLRPDRKFNQLLRWLVATLAERYSVHVHCVVCLSTHFHLVVTVPNEDVSDFMHDLDMHLAKAVQVLRRYASGVVWEPGKLSIVELVTPEAVVEQIAYALVNPVAAGLVYRHDQWPGVTQKVEDIGVSDIGADPPDFYFDKTKWDAARTPLVMPDCLDDMNLEDAQALIAAEVARQSAKARAEVKAKGWNVMGALGAQHANPYQRAKSWQGLHTMAPRIAAGRGRTKERVEAIEELVEFWDDHRKAKLRWMAGDRDVVFPAGTYWMKVHHGARVAPFT